MLTLHILSLFSVLLTLGLLMVIMGQYKEMEILLQSNEQLTKSKQMAYNKLQYEIDLKSSLQDLKTKGEQVLKDSEAELTKLTTQLEGKTPETSACQEQLKIKIEELGPLEETVNSISGAFKAKSEIWVKDIVDLKASLTAPSPICNYLKDDKEAMKLCSTQTISN
ncbi:hypothetical protein CRENBAI_023081 [Crenichthys baileyi]|uniref:Uncharacterized protein n=1 Tax=Crenichthys baileyi TaxID=28760 RepID=A0AAV9RQ93_9TELE